jgi:hypothetical protein
LEVGFDHDDVVADLNLMKIKQWIEKAIDREQWRKVVEEAKVHPRLQRRQEGRKERIKDL